MFDCGNSDLMMTDAQWQQAVDLKNLLKKAFEATKRLQFADFTPGYLYRKRTGLWGFYQHNGSLLGEEIAIKSMRKRELLNNRLCWLQSSWTSPSWACCPRNKQEKQKKRSATLL
jgi:hypothetical protein